MRQDDELGCGRILLFVLLVALAPFILEVLGFILLMLVIGIGRLFSG